MFRALHAARNALFPGDVLPDRGNEAVPDKSGFSGTGGPGDAGQRAYRDVQGDVVEVVLVRPGQDQMPGGNRPVSGGGHAPFAGEPCSGRALGVFQNFRKGTLRQNTAAVGAGAGAHVHQMVRRVQNLFVVLHYQDRVALVPERPERAEQAVRIGVKREL